MKEADCATVSTEPGTSVDTQQSISKPDSHLKYYKVHHLHKDTSPSWLAETEFNKTVELQYVLKTKDIEKALQDDMAQLSNLMQPVLIQAQLRAFFEDINDKDAQSSCAVMNGGQDTEPLEKGNDVIMQEENVRKRRNIIVQNHRYHLKSPNAPK